MCFNVAAPARAIVRGRSANEGLHLPTGRWLQRGRARAGRQRYCGQEPRTQASHLRMWRACFNVAAPAQARNDCRSNRCESKLIPLPAMARGPPGPSRIVQRASSPSPTPCFSVAAPAGYPVLSRPRHFAVERFNVAAPAQALNAAHCQGIPCRCRLQRGRARADAE